MRRLAAALAAKLPELAKLELWFGSTNYGGDCTVKDLAPLLAGKLFPKVVRLGLRNAEFTDDIAAAVIASPIAKRLVALDLSMGTMTDVGAQTLAARSAGFLALEELNVDDNFLSPDGVRTLRKAFGKRLVSDAQKAPDDSIAGELHYYVSVGE